MRCYLNDRSLDTKKKGWLIKLGTQMGLTSVIYAPLVMGYFVIGYRNKNVYCTVMYRNNKMFSNVLRN